MKQTENGRGFVVGGTANYLVSCHLWLPLNWKIEFFECALKQLRFSLSVLDSCFIGKNVIQQPICQVH